MTADTGARRSLAKPVLIGLLAVIVLVIATGLAFLYGRYAVGTGAEAEAPHVTAPPGALPAAGNAGMPAAAGPGDTLGAPTNALKMTDSRAIGDWLYRCWEFPGNVGVKCSIVQQVVEASSKATLIRWTIGQDDKGGLVSEWLTPTNVFVDHGITLADVTEKPVTLPFTSCSPGFCRAVAKLAPDFAQSLGKAAKVSISYSRLEGGPLTVSPSTKGLSSALALIGPAP